jgi:hypothetical protein
VNGTHWYRPAAFVKLDLIVARLEAVNETAIAIVKLHLSAMIRISLHYNPAGARLVCPGALR